MTNYLIAIIGGIVVVYGSAAIAGYVREWWMFRDFVSRMPQTPEEWEAFWEEDWRHELMLDDYDRRHPDD